jgi:hypothetical protein
VILGSRAGIPRPSVMCFSAQELQEASAKAGAGPTHADFQRREARVPQLGAAAVLACSDG